MEFSTSDLLQNASYSAKHYCKFEHYMTLINLAKGIVPVTLNVESLKELEKVHLKIDPLTDYVTNIFDYALYIRDNKPEVVYVINASNKQCVGTLAVNLNGDQLQITAAHNEAIDEATIE
ncbi:hypothetical protein [Mamestra configurata nucleopolyhedrovirus A]|uniref:Uncharacterized protein n=1 Tax=Mamestra configurata nucleopolyhedrovirus TaxID=207830 RepID=Q71A58_NPVMC|nr:hypothetical protein [Mamestra configurata nucleopolyhedrovirus A]